jgi:hypothetical protein
MDHRSSCPCWECMRNIISKELQLVMSPSFNILLILIRLLLTPEKASCQESGRMFLDKKLWWYFSLHLRDFWCGRPCQKGQSSIRIILLARYFQDRTMKRREFHAKRASQFFWVHGEHSMCHHGHKVSEKLAQRSIERVTYSPYSPDISRCDFWLFRMPKHSMKDREFQSQEVTWKASAKSGTDLTFGEVQSDFQE